MLSVFNVGDTIGKWAATNKYIGFIGDTLTFILTYLRFLFVIFGVLLLHQWGPNFLVGTGNNWAPLLNLALFSFTNGYCLSLLAIKSPSKAPNEYKDAVGIFVGIFITVGIVMGSGVSIPLAK